MQHPILAVLEGDGLDADDAAWALIADAAETALRLPGLSQNGVMRMERLQAAALRAAGLPPRRPLREEVG